MSSLNDESRADTKSMWVTALLSPTATIQQAIRNLEQSTLQIVLVVDENKTLLGTVTDGDIRRGLLKGLNLDSSIKQIYFESPIVVPSDLDRESVMQIMQINKIHQLPIVDSKRKVIGLHIWDELLQPKEHSNTMVIMAGGKGTRLKPYTDCCPKPMLSVRGKPMLEHIILRAKSSGIKNFIFAIHYLGHMIEDYFGDGRQWQVKITYLREETPLGTAGALSLLEKLPSKPILVTNGDVMTDINYGELIEFHEKHRANATMAVRLYEWEHPFGVVITKGVDIVGFEEKPISRSHINAGIYVIEPIVLELLRDDEFCDMPELFLRAKRSELSTIAYPMHEPWLDVGRPDDLLNVRGEEGAD